PPVAFRDDRDVFRAGRWDRGALQSSLGCCGLMLLPLVELCETMRNKRDGEQVYAGCPGIEEDGGASIGRGACSDHVVDQNDLLSLHRFSAAPAHREGPRDILLARLLAEPDLRCRP